MISVNMFVSDTKKALEFYKFVFGAIPIEEKLETNPGERSARFKIGESRFALADENPNWESQSPITLGGNPIVIQLTVTNLKETLQKLLKKDSILITPSTEENPIINIVPDKQFANIKDPFGHIWTLSNF